MRGEDVFGKRLIRINKPVYLTNKGVAVIAAIESGLLPTVDGGWDDTAFQKFWSLYEKKLAEYYKDYGK